MSARRPRSGRGRRSGQRCDHWQRPHRRWKRFLSWDRDTGPAWAAPAFLRSGGDQRFSNAPDPPTSRSMLTQILEALSGGGETSEGAENAGRIAIAAILVEVARADETYLAREQSMIDRVLAERFGIGPAEAASLREEGEEAQEEAVDLVHCTRAIKDAVPYEDRVGVIEALWCVILADGDVDYQESALVRRWPGCSMSRIRIRGLPASVWQMRCSGRALAENSGGVGRDPAHPGAASDQMK